MAIARLGRQVKRSYQSIGFSVKLSAVVILGLCFVLVWSNFSSYSVTSQRETFDDIAQPIGVINSSGVRSNKMNFNKGKDGDDPRDLNSDGKGKDFGNASLPLDSKKEPEQAKVLGNDGLNRTRDEHEGEQVTVERENGGGDDEDVDNGGNAKEEVEGEEMNDNDERDQLETGEDNGGSEIEVKTMKKGVVFDPKARYEWKLCTTRSKHNYIPCIDFESRTGKTQVYRHHERSCPRSGVVCLVPLPAQGYGTPVQWPESKSKIMYKNVAHPKLDAYIKSHNWLVESGEYLTFPQKQSAFIAGIEHYLESIEEMVPDIEWGKNIRLVLDIGCKDSSLGASLSEKDVLTLSFGLKDDLVDLAQVALERGLPAIVGFFSSRRLPFPSGVFDAIHCGECSIFWPSSGGKLLLEMNRILRPGGYFILSTKHTSLEGEEALSKLAASICWNILADRMDDSSDIGMKIYQKPETNGIYQLRRKKIPPLCKETEKPDAAWYTPMGTCLHAVPEAIEERGNEWPAEWPQRLHTFPEWMNGKERLVAEGEHWKSIVNNSYLKGIGIDWSTIRNVMDMKAVNGGFAAALSDLKVWVMNVVPVHAPDTLPIIFERGLLGIYHDWCEAFSSYPRSYDLLHADHLFSRLKSRCKQPVVIVVEMDRLLRAGGWVIVRDKVEILNPLEEILRRLHWEIRLTFAQDKEGILCAQKTLWRP